MTIGAGCCLATGMNLGGAARKAEPPSCDFGETRTGRRRRMILENRKEAKPQPPEAWERRALKVSAPEVFSIQCSVFSVPCSVRDVTLIR